MTRPQFREIRQSDHGPMLYCKGCESWELTTDFYKRSDPKRKVMVWHATCKACMYEAKLERAARAAG